MTISTGRIPRTRLTISIAMLLLAPTLAIWGDQYKLAAKPTAPVMDPSSNLPTKAKGDLNDVTLRCEGLTGNCFSV